MKITITSLLFFLVMIVELASAGTLLHNGANLPSLRDNTTLTDARNVLKYLQVLGFPSNKIAAADTVGTLIIFSNRTEANSTAMTKTVSYCYRNYGHSFTSLITNTTIFLVRLVIWQNLAMPPSAIRTYLTLGQQTANNARSQCLPTSNCRILVSAQVLRYVHV
ncbi:CCQ_1a_G0014120.mRNA.1.CDS.1 [Saccharomyces cerevisiae]|nr:CCQ_1a_G0014120.mRNA.1.CDS.1 [Saccharomyces cerevisiae]CAI7249604.1 CCQ_1a_G0014120.mRNA.1.CDS.1 [Saccharomyces cerevisiae]